jgi:hypothetical protein
VTWRDRARTAAYDAYHQAAEGPGIQTKATVVAQLLATADNNHTGVSTVVAGLAVAAMVAERFVSIPDPDVFYAGFDIT